MNYWGYRIDTNDREFFWKEIEHGRLRQGWGYDEKQALNNEVVDESAKGNLKIYESVKKGDILLVPRIQLWDEVAIVEATQDFKVGYEFLIDPERNDYGHVFPVRLLKIFSRHNKHVAADIRKTLKCQSRFWSISKYKELIDKILSVDQDELRSTSNYEERFRLNVEKAFDEKSFAERVYAELNKDTQASEWEYILIEGFKRILPRGYKIESTSNRTEYKHGADIIIRVPGIFDSSYIIAIQVKDYSDIVSKEAIDQICNADFYYKNVEGSTLIDKYLIITKAASDNNVSLSKYARDKGVKVLFDSDIKRLLSAMAKSFLRDWQ